MRPSSYCRREKSEAEKIEALDLGANDYVNKPAAIGGLMAVSEPHCVTRQKRKG